MGTARYSLRRVQKVRVLVALATVVALATGCGETGGDDTNTDTATRSFVADNGTIEIPASPKRIVALGNAVLALYNLGVRPVGVSEVTTGLEWLSATDRGEYDKVDKVGSSTIDVEAIAGLQPDLIVVQVPESVWNQRYRSIESRLSSVAPLVLIANNGDKWKEVGERTADALGRTGEFDRSRAEYDRLVGEVRSLGTTRFADTKFAQVNRYASTPAGSWVMDYAGRFCATPATEAGLDYPAQPGNQPSATLPMERLSDLAAYDVITYPLGSDGEPIRAIAPVLQSSVWQGLPAVAAGRAIGVQCPLGSSDYTSWSRLLRSLKTGLERLPK